MIFYICKGFVMWSKHLVLQPPLKAFLEKAFIDLESSSPIHAMRRMEWRFAEAAFHST